MVEDEVDFAKTPAFNGEAAPDRRLPSGLVGRFLAERALEQVRRIVDRLRKHFRIYL
jgi:hypothetical protein